MFLNSFSFQIGVAPSITKADNVKISRWLLRYSTLERFFFCILMPSVWYLTYLLHRLRHVGWRRWERRRRGRAPSIRGSPPPRSSPGRTSSERTITNLYVFVLMRISNIRFTSFRIDSCGSLSREGRARLGCGGKEVLWLPQRLLRYRIKYFITNPTC